MSATIIDQLADAAGIGGVGPTDNLDINPIDAILSPDSLYDPKLKAYYDSEPKKRVYVPTPESWKESYPYAERIEINGLRYIIMADQDVMLPESVAAVWENKKAMERLLHQQQNAMRRLMEYRDISQVPHWYR